ncbi:MAG: glycosyltransferase family 39 protein, partial [Anaerolineaceae bacterium]|nr:glycosyltransferase family 39 protein [Anaerolineaceae bacterium]
MNIPEDTAITNTSDQTGKQPDHTANPGEDSHVHIRAVLPSSGKLEVTVEIQNEEGRTLHAETLEFTGNETGKVSSTRSLQTQPVATKKINQFATDLWKKTTRNWPMVFFGIALFTYLITRLINLDVFPIYFFTDEAVQTVLASDFVRDDFKNYDKEFFPTYFVNGSQYNLSTSVYLQVLPYMIFDKSIWVTRGTSVLLTLLAAVFIGLLLKNIFKEPYFWLGTLFLSITPAWFLHSRTAFETALATTFYSVFLYFYLMYRTRSPRYLYAAVGMGALTFYTYSPAQMVMAVTAVFLLISDFRYHWQNRKIVLKGIGIAAILVLPYVRYLIVHPLENYNHLQILDSYWVQNIPLGQKLNQFGSFYLNGLNPFYWYLPNDNDFSRHLMKAYGHIARWTIPFAMVGMITLFRNFRKSESRVILAAMLAAPAGAALVGTGITRNLFMVIPAAIITTLGAAAILRWLEKIHLPRVLLSVGMLVSL